MVTIIVPKHMPPRPDEPAWLLRETNELDKAKRSLRRRQRVWVNRNDQIVFFTKDLGAAASFTYPELQIPAEWVHTVAELQGIAEQVRDGTDVQELMAERQSESTLVTDWLEQVERRRKVIANRSVFGPAGKTQRNGFSLKGAPGLRRQ